MITWTQELSVAIKYCYRFLLLHIKMTVSGFSAAILNFWCKWTPRDVEDSTVESDIIENMGVAVEISSISYS
jgi:hypothetical protein